MHESGNNNKKLQFEQLLKLFNEVLEQSEDYHIVFIPKLGYIAFDGKYMPNCESDYVLSNIMFQQYFPTPKEMAYNLMQNLRWQWYTQNERPVSTDEYKSISEMDNDLSEKDYPEYFQMLRTYELEINRIIRSSIND